MEEDYDVVIIGAGASGINAAYKVKTEMPPGTRFTVLEGRDVVGGTWNFFRYPGLRSDSYLTGFGFRWRPWSEDKEIADGPMIQRYLEASVREARLDQHIQFRHRVARADWSTPDARWTLDVDVGAADKEDGEETTTTKKTIRAGFVLACSGYYDYKTPLQAEIPGIANFQGRVVHPQFWPDDLDYTDKRVVVIGSGATTVTILPVLARTARHVTMLQRSPSYVLPLPSAPGHIYRLRRWLPKRLADALNFWKDVLFQSFLRLFCSAFPLVARRMLLRAMARELRGTGIPLDPHFTPAYNPWSQRLCVCPDGDFYDALRQPNADVVTGHIETVTADGITVRTTPSSSSNNTNPTTQHLDADIIVTATGLNLLLLGGVDLTVDHRPVPVGARFAWRSCMLEGVPNLAMVLGYTDMSWTLGSDACLRLLLRVLARMRALGAAVVTPVVAAASSSGQEEKEGGEKNLRAEPIINMSSTYFVVARDKLPRAAADGRDPWGARKGYIPESWLAWFGSNSAITKGLEFTRAGGKPLAGANGYANGHAKTA